MVHVFFFFKVNLIIVAKTLFHNEVTFTGSRNLTWNLWEASFGTCMLKIPFPVLHRICRTSPMAQIRGQANHMQQSSPGPSTPGQDTGRVFSRKIWLDSEESPKYIFIYLLLLNHSCFTILCQFLSLPKYVLISGESQQMAQFNVNSPLPNMYSDQLLGPLVLNMVRKSRNIRHLRTPS